MPGEKAFVFITAELGKERQVLENLKNLVGVKESYMTFGLYDIVSLVETEGANLATKGITETIRKLPGVRLTITMMIVQ